MKRSIIAFLLFAVTCTCFAQTQHGIVKTRGRMDATGNVTAGVRLSGVTISIRNSATYVSGDKGAFSFPVSSKTFFLSNVRKNGYQLCDRDLIGRGYSYSSNPLIIVMETPDNTLSDRLAAEHNIRRILSRQLVEKEDEIEELKKQKKISDQQYHKLIQELYENQKKNENLIEEMAQRYSTIDFDELDDFQRKVAFYIQNGELTRADSLLNTRGNMEERSAELDRMDAAIKADAEELAKRQKAHKMSLELKAKALQVFAADCYSHFEICKIQHKNDSAAYWLKLRASKDALNYDWQIDYAYFITDYLANYDLAQEYILSIVAKMSNDSSISDETRGHVIAGLAHIYLQSERYDQAINMYQKALDLFDKDLFQHCVTLTKQANCYEGIGEYNKALELLFEADTIFHNNNYNDPSLLLDMYSTFGSVLCKNGDFEECKRYFDLAIKLSENESSIDLPKRATAYLEAAALYLQLNQYNRSEELYEKALEIAKQFFDEKHPFLATVYNEMGVLYARQNRFTEAINVLQMGLEVNSANRFGPSYAQECSNLAYVYSEIDDLKEAERYQLEAYNIRLKLYGENNILMINEYNSLGSLYLSMGDYDKAQNYIEKAISIRKAESGELHPSLISSYSFIAGIHLRRGQIKEALDQFLLVLDITEHFYGEDKVQTADALTNVGGMYMYLEKYDDAINMIKKALEIHVKMHGEIHLDVAGDYNGLAQTYMAMGKYQEAIVNFTKAIEIRKEILGPKSSKLKSLYGFMKQIYEKLEDAEQVQLYTNLLEEIQE